MRPWIRYLLKNSKLDSFIGFESSCLSYRTWPNRPTLVALLCNSRFRCEQPHLLSCLSRSLKTICLKFSERAEDKFPQKVRFTCFLFISLLSTFIPVASSLALTKRSVLPRKKTLSDNSPNESRTRLKSCKRQSNNIFCLRKLLQLFDSNSAFWFLSETKKFLPESLAPPGCEVGEVPSCMKLKEA